MRLRGFIDGAGRHAMRPKIETDIYQADYVKGYTDGQKATHDYAESSASELDVVLQNIVTIKLSS